MKWLLIFAVLFILGKVTTELIVWNSAKRVDKNMTRVAEEVNKMLPQTGELLRVDKVEYSDHVMRYSGSVLATSELTNEVKTKLRAELVNLYCGNVALKRANVSVEYLLTKAAVASYNDKVHTQTWSTVVRPENCL